MPPLGVWATTEQRIDGAWVARDQMGRPAINTVFNNGLVDPSSGQTKNRFNKTPPSEQRSAFGGLFRNNIVATLTNINAALGTDAAFGCMDYDAATAGAIADILLPDVITPMDGSSIESLMCAGPLGAPPVVQIGDVSVTLQGFTSGREGNGPRPVERDFNLKPLVVVGSATFGTLGFQVEAGAQTGTRMAALRAEAKVGDYTVVQYSPAFPMTVN